MSLTQTKIPGTHFAAGIIAVPAVGLSFLHSIIYGFSLWNTLLISFIVVNLVICWWELALHFAQDTIRAKYDQLTKIGFYERTPEGQKLRDSTPMLFAEEKTIEEFLTMKYWANIWIEYCRFDENYANPITFQYVIDVMNGFSSFFPNVFFLINMFIPMFSPRVIGIVGVMTFYQKWYGTVMYIFTFHNNGLHKLITKNEYYSKVILSNGIWLTFPIIGFVKACQMIMTDSFLPIQ